jgi:hypothetical protein
MVRRAGPLSLARHPDTPCDAVEAIIVNVAWSAGDLALDFTVRGDMGALSLPAPAAQMRADDLWRTTCLEAFTRAGDGPAYDEFNFSPSGEWAAYRFGAYRDRLPDPVIAAPRIMIARNGDALILRARIFVPAPDDARLALSAVMAEADGRISYWALAHPPGKPDFHHSDGFALALRAETP